MAERRSSHHLCQDRCHPVRAARRPTYTTAIGFLIGSILTVAIAATIKFGVLPKVEAFVGFSFKKFWRSLLFRSARSGHRTIWARLRYSSLSTIAPMLPG